MAGVRLPLESYPAAGAGVRAGQARLPLRGDVQHHPRLYQPVRQGRTGHRRRHRRLHLLHPARRRCTSTRTRSMRSASCFRCSAACACCATGAASSTSRPTARRSSPKRRSRACTSIAAGAPAASRRPPARPCVRLHHRPRRAAPDQRAVHPRTLPRRLPDRRSRGRGRGALRAACCSSPAPIAASARRLEFTYGGAGAYRAPAPTRDARPTTQWADFLYMRTNTKGVHAERWRHAHGCGRFFNALRDTTTDHFLATYRSGEPRPTPADAARDASDFRTPSGGRIDRARPLRFTFDGRRYQGLAGDTLASALLANGVHLVGRSFKYHRPRGVLAAGAEEPNALVDRRPRRRRAARPNLRATQVELYEGLIAREPEPLAEPRASTSAPSTTCSSPLLPAGFYYKTFMWPPRVPGERCTSRRSARAAGLGGAPTRRTPTATRSATPIATCWWSAPARPASPPRSPPPQPAPASSCATSRPEFGGSLLARPRRDDRRRPRGRLARRDPRRARPPIRASRCCRAPRPSAISPTTSSASPNGSPTTCRPRRASAPRERLWQVRAREVVLAAGAIERPLVFPGNDRPGVMLAGAARTYLQSLRRARRQPRGRRRPRCDTAYQRRAATCTPPACESPPSPICAPDRGPANWPTPRAPPASSRRRPTVLGTAAARVAACARRRSTGGSGPAATHRLRRAADVRRLHAQRPPVLAVPRQAAWTRRSGPSCPAVRRAQALGRRLPRRLRPRRRTRRRAAAGAAAAAAPARGAGAHAATRRRRHRRRPGALPSARPDAGGKAFVDFQNDVTKPRTSRSRRARASARSSTSSATPRPAWRPTRARPPTSTPSAIVARSARAADPGGRPHHLPHALHAGDLRQLRRASRAATVRPRAQDPDPRLGRAPRRGVRGRRPVEARPLLPPRRRGHARRGRARVPGRAQRASACSTPRRSARSRWSARTRPNS